MGYGGYGSLGGCCCEQVEVECGSCLSGTGPSCWRLTVDSGPFAGVYYVPYQHGTSICTWECRHGPCNTALYFGHYFFARLSTFSDSGSYHIVATIQYQLPSSSVVSIAFQNTYPNPADCSQPHELNQTGGGGVKCLAEPLFSPGSAPCHCFGPSTSGTCCFCAKCQYCKQGTDKNITGYQVVIEGLTDGANCNGSNLSGTYIFDWPWNNTSNHPADPTLGEGHDGSSCQGKTINVTSEAGCSCGAEFAVRANLLIQYNSISGKGELIFRFNGTGFPLSATYTWRRLIDSEFGMIDCAAISEVLDASDLTVSGGCDIMDASGATVTITPIIE